MRKIRVLVVDDSALMRRVITDLLNADPELEVIGMAGNGEQAIAKADQLQPDLVTLDIEMPVLDGLGVLREWRRMHKNIPVIMFSTLSERGSAATLEALALGASDYVTKPAGVTGVMEAGGRIKEDLIPRIKAICQKRLAPPKASTPLVERKPTPSVRPLSPLVAPGRIEILAIGVSTGGPNALEELIPALGKVFPIPVVIVQHMPPLFTKNLAQRLALASGMNCMEGQTGQIVNAGEVYIAPGGFHMIVERVREGVGLRLNEDPPENSCRPAVDPLFRSVANVYGARCLAVVLTGMGQDGLKGCEVLREVGAQILAQDEASSVVWGMPGAIVGAGLADRVLPLKDLAAEIITRVQCKPGASVTPRA